MCKALHTNTKVTKIYFPLFTETDPMATLASAIKELPHSNTNATHELTMTVHSLQNIILRGQSISPDPTHSSAGRYITSGSPKKLLY